MNKEKLVHILKKLLKVSPLVILVGLLIFLGFEYYKTTPGNVSFSSVSSSSITVSWVTDTPTKGVALVMKEENVLPIYISTLGKESFFDTRDIRYAELMAAYETEENIFENEGIDVYMSDFVTEVDVVKGTYYTHHVELKNLDPETGYQIFVGDGILFRRVNDSFGNGVVYTGIVPDEVSAPRPVYGYVYDAKNQENFTYGDLVPVSDGIVYVNLKDQETGEESSVVSSSLTEDGSWYADISMAVDGDGENFLSLYNDEYVLVEILLDGGTSGLWEKVVPLYESTPADDLFLNDPEYNPELDDPRQLRPVQSSSLFFDQVVKGVGAKYDNPDSCRRITSCSWTYQVERSGKLVWRKCNIDPAYMKKMGCSGNTGAGDALGELNSSNCKKCENDEGFYNNNNSICQNLGCSYQEPTPPQEVRSPGKSSSDPTDDSKRADDGSAEKSSSDPTDDSKRADDRPAGKSSSDPIDESKNQSEQQQTYVSAVLGHIVKSGDKCNSEPCYCATYRAIPVILPVGTVAVTGFVSPPTVPGYVFARVSGVIIGSGDYCVEVNICRHKTVAGVTYSNTDGKVCNKNGNVCQDGSCVPNNKDSNNSTLINNNLVGKVSAQEEYSEYITDSSLGVIEGIESGIYSFEYDGDTYLFEVLPTDVSDSNSSVLIYLDDNANGVYDESTDRKVSDLASEIKVSTLTQYYTYDLQEGYNFVSFPFVFNLDNGNTASSLISFLNENYSDNIYSISKFNSTWKIVGQNVQTYDVNDFQIIPGEGYMIKAKADVTITITGRPVKFESDADSAPITLYEGWNLIGLYGSRVKTYTAKSLIDNINTQSFTGDNVSRWESSTQKYDGIQVEDGTMYGFDFPINIGQSYFVRILEGRGNWNPQTR